MNDLPNWVYDVVGELARHHFEHPTFYQQMPGGEYVKADGCGCQALDAVPAEVLERSKVIKSYLSSL